MKDMTLKDLYNPNKITGIFPRYDTRAKFNWPVTDLDESQAFQEYPKLIELWEQLPDGRLLIVKRWRKSSIYAIEYDNGSEFCAGFKPYIYPKVK